MKKIFQIPHFVRKKIISSQFIEKSSVFAMNLVLENVRSFKTYKKEVLKTLAIVRDHLFVSSVILTTSRAKSKSAI